MATPEEIRAWAAEQGMAISGRGRIPAVIRAAYESATGDASEVEDLAPAPAPPADVADDETLEPGLPFRPAEKKDPPAGRTRQPRAKRTSKPATAAVEADIAGKTGFILMMPAVAWQTRDPYCGAVAVQQVPPISAALAALFVESPEVVEWFTGKGGNFMKWLNLAAACQPLLTTVVGHHVTHTIGDQPDAGRFAVPEDQYAA